MRVFIIYTIFISIVWLLGMALDILGLYASVKFASKNKISISKFGYIIMNFGEILELIANKSMVALPLLFILTILKVI